MKYHGLGVGVINQPNAVGVTFPTINDSGEGFRWVFDLPNLFHLFYSSDGGKAAVTQVIRSILVAFLKVSRDDLKYAFLRPDCLGAGWRRHSSKLTFNLTSSPNNLQQSRQDGRSTTPHRP